MLTELPFDLQSLRAAYADGLDPADVVRESFRRIAAAADPGIFLHLVDQATVVAQAEALGPYDPAKPLWGIPFAIKDNIDAAGAPTTAACPAFAYTAEADAFAVALLRDAGALLVGKTNLDQFASGLVGMRTPFLAPKNALDPAIVPGGSSSGSAVAVARGLVGFALGTDTAGSGRVPAALNGIVGLKPTLGAISATGVVPACRTLDTISVFALTVEDAYAVLRAAARYDATDAYSRPVAAPPLAALPPACRVGVPSPATREFWGDTVQAAHFQARVADLAALGGEIVEIDFAPFHEIAAMLYNSVWVAERHSVIEDLMAADPQAIHPVVREVIGAAKKFSATDAFRAVYRLADLKRAVAPLLAGVDLLCVPSIPAFCSVADEQADPIAANARLGVYTNFVNFLDLCGIAVPTAPRADGRPGSVTLLAAAGKDAAVAALASVLMRQGAPRLGATPWPLPPAAPRCAAPQPDEIALAVVGAHMSGLPLNSELTSRGGRFLRAARTAPVYRLFSLSGGPPYRPGLLRGETGAAIALEVWALPAVRFGEFVKGIPRPLGIGTLTLEDGSEVKGFLCEASGTVGAEDITRFGGWRGFSELLPTS